MRRLSQQAAQASLKLYTQQFPRAAYLLGNKPGIQHLLAQEKTFSTQKDKVDISKYQIHYLKYQPGNPVLQNYYKLRKEVFDEMDLAYYQDHQATRFDALADNQFIIITDDKDNVVAGRRFIIHEPGSQAKLQTEKNCEMSIAAMFPTLTNTQNMRYAEIGGVVVKKDVQGTAISKTLYKETFTKMKEFDFILAEVIPTNLQRFFYVCEKYAVPNQHFRLDLPATYYVCALSYDKNIDLSGGLKDTQPPGEHTIKSLIEKQKRDKEKHESYSIK